MGISAQQLIAELRSFDDRRQIVRAMRRGLNRAAKTSVTPAIRASALAILPKRGGLNAYVARASITTLISYASRSAGIRLRGRLKGGRSDVKRIDDGTVRAPAWGHRTAWHTEAVAPGWFTRPAAETGAWHEQVDAEVDRVLAELRG